MNRSHSIKWYIAVLLVASILLSNVGYALAADSSPVEGTQSTVSTLSSFGNLTENGAANADIFVSTTASELETFAVQELKAAVKKVSGADLLQVTDLSSQLFHIILGTPASMPEITGLFADDLTYLANSDGFAVRMIDNKIYIIGTEAKGVLNGVYDFLEENAGILWTRGVEELGTLYDVQPTISITKVNYAEKSPFSLRGWNACGQGSTGVHHSDAATRYMEGRNKQNIRVGTISREIGNIYIDGNIATTNGMLPFGTGTTLLLDKYFSTHPEYYMTNADGTPKKDQYGSNLNFYSAEAANALAAELVNYAQTNKVKYVGHSIQDNQYFMMVQNGVDLASLPFTADNGVTVNPTDSNYKSTVFFNFLNKVAKKVKELNSDIKIVSLAYIYCEYAPAVPIEDNIIIQFAPIYSDDHLPVETSPSNAQVKKNLEDWTKLTKDIVVYNYYGSMQGTIYSRPIAKKVQADFQYYARLGLLGLTPEGVVDSSNTQYYTNGTWNMNNLYFWLINKLFWDPYADLDALTDEFCKKAYGAAAPYMKEYYRLIQSGWDKYTDYVWYTSGGDTYIKKFIIDAGIADSCTTALENAYNAANDVQKKRIAPIKTTFAAQLAIYANFVNEDGKAYYTSAGKEAVISDQNLDFSQGPWSQVTPLTVFKGTSMEDCPRAVQVRLMWDNDNLYIAYKVPNELIGTSSDPYTKVPPLNADGTWWNGGPEFMETYIAGNMANMSEYSAYYTDAIDQKIQYNVGPTFQRGPYQWESHSRLITAEAPQDRYWANVLVIPFSTLGVTAQTAKVGGTFVANIYGGTSPYYGWCGANVWSTASFRLIELVPGQTVCCDAEHPHMIYTKQDLDAIRNHVVDGKITGYFKLANDIVFDDADFQEGGLFYNGGLGWIPIGHNNQTGYFSGTYSNINLDGDGHSITNLKIFGPSGRLYNAFIAGPETSTIKNLRFVNTHIEAYGGAGVVYGTGYGNNVVDNVTIDNAQIIVLGGTVSPTGLFASQTMGTASNITIVNSGITRTDPTTGTKGTGWAQALFTGRLRENTKVSNVNISNCIGDFFAYSALFAITVDNGAEVNNVSIQNSNVDYGHLAYYNFAGSTSGNAGRSSVLFNDINVNVNTTDANTSAKKIFPNDTGFKMTNAVLIFNQTSNVPFNTAVNADNADNLNNVFLIRKYPGGNGSTVENQLICAAGNIRTVPTYSGAMELEADQTANLVTLSDGAQVSQITGLKFISSDPLVAAISADGTVTAAAAGTATVSAYATVGGQDCTLGSTQVTVTGNLDIQPPVTSAQVDGIPGQNGGYVSTATVTLSAVDDSSAVASTLYSLDGGATWNNYTGPVTLNQSGVYQLQYYSVDGSGNVEQTKSAPITIEEPAITGIASVDLLTTAGLPPQLPTLVTASYNDSTTKLLPVIWASVNPLDYAQQGTFTVTGSVEGTSIQAVANVTVTNTAITTLTGPDTSTIGSQIELRLGLGGVTGISAQDITVSYDPNIFDFVSAESILVGTTINETTENTSGGAIRLIISTTGEENAITGNAEVVSLKFISKTSGSGNIAATNAVLSNGQGDVVFAAAASKTIVIDADKTELISAVAAAKDLYNSAVEGISIGMYPQGSKARLNTAIAKAETQAANILTQAQVLQAVEDLAAAVRAFQSLVITTSTGDINGIPGYDIGDLGIISFNYGKRVGDPGWDSIKKADINGDGEIGLYDLALVAKKILGN